MIIGKDGKVCFCLINLVGSKYLVWFYMEFKGEVFYFYVVVCCLDEDGNINNDYNIYFCV